MTDLAGRRVTVTGGAGFLGSFVVEKLKAMGCGDVFVPRKRDYDLTRGADIERMMSDARPEVLFHLAAVVGGIGSVPGAFLGGICVALIEAGWSAYFDITSRDIVVFSLLIVVFVLRPGGLLGFAGPKPRDV